jgi:hypothetical protein
MSDLCLVVEGLFCRMSLLQFHNAVMNTHSCNSEEAHVSTSKQILDQFSNVYDKRRQGFFNVYMGMYVRTYSKTAYFITSACRQIAGRDFCGECERERGEENVKSISSQKRSDAWFKISRLQFEIQFEIQLPLKFFRGPAPTFFFQSHHSENFVLRGTTMACRVAINC